MRVANLTTLVLAAAVSLAFVVSSAKAQILVTDTIYTQAQPSGDYNSSLSGTTVENFNSLSIGANYNVNAGFGTINQVDVIAANQYGGAPVSSGPSLYAVQTAGAGEIGHATPITTTTLTLNTPSSYFGFYWSAGDAHNTLEFFNGSTLVGSFTTQSLMDKLPSGYYGNPNPSFLHQDSGEPFGFVNFLATPGTQFTSVVLIDSNTSGFESDNWTTRAGAYNPITDGVLPGTPISLVTTTGGVSTTTGVTSVTVNTNTGSLEITLAGGHVTTLDYAAGAAPGAPAPPMTACIAFAAVLLLQAVRRGKAGTA